MEKLNINDVVILNDRVENLKEKEYYDIITSRAVSELRILAELSLPYLKIGGKVLALKAHVTEELKPASASINILGGDKPNIEEITLPKNIGQRCIVEVKKITKTENIYPRSYDKILKKPLKKNLK